MYENCIFIWEGRYSVPSTREFFFGCDGGPTKTRLNVAVLRCVVFSHLELSRVNLCIRENTNESANKKNSGEISANFTKILFWSRKKSHECVALFSLEAKVQSYMFWIWRHGSGISTRDLWEIDVIWSLH